MSVIVKNNNLDGALKIFKARVAKDGTLTAARARQEYKKPGVKRREEKKKNTQNCHKNNRRYAS